MSYNLMKPDNISNMPRNRVLEMIGYLPKAMTAVALDLYDRKLKQQELMRIYDLMEICATNNCLDKEQMYIFLKLIQFNKMM